MARKFRRWRVRFYKNRSGRYPVKDFLEDLTSQQNADFEKHVKLLSDFGVELGMPYAREVTGYKPLWELRPKGFRILYFIDSHRNFILLHGFKKKRGKIPQRHIDIALERREDYREKYE